MSLRLALILALLFGVVVAYLTFLNPTGIQALLIGAFLVGVALAFILGMVRDLGRTYREYQRGRRARRADALDGIYQRGVQTQLAGRAEEAARAYEEVLRRDPAHTDAPIRFDELARQRGDVLATLNHRREALRAEERTETLLAAADDYRRVGRADDAIQMYQRVLARDRDHPIALHGLRDVAVERGRWAEALQAQGCLLRIVPREERAAEDAWLAGIQYELGRALLAGGDAHAAAGRFRDALRARPDFVPAALALGDLHLKAGDTREAQRVWERALEAEPAPPLLSRLEQLHRAGGRPGRMISLYRDAATRHPEDLAIAFGLGRVYFELAMLDEAAEQFQKLEVRAPDLYSIHAYLGAIFERRGQVREAFEEYRRALRFPGGLEWLHHCGACGATQPSWFDRCSACRRWNTSRP